MDGHGGLPEERPEIYDKTETLAASGTSPRRSSSSTATRDVRAPFLNFELAVAAFEEHGIEYEAHTYPEGHGFATPTTDRPLPARRGVLRAPPRRLPLRAPGTPSRLGAAPPRGAQAVRRFLPPLTAR